MFYLGRIVQAIAKNAVQSLAPLAAFVAFRDDPVASLAAAAIVLVSLMAVVACLRYWFFRYRITGHSILIRDGIFKKKQLDIGFDRIQSVNTRQNLLYRLLGLTTVTLDSAGSSAQEGYLPAVRNEVANALRARIRESSSGAGPSPGEAAAKTSTVRELMRPATGDIALAGLSSGRIFLVLAALGPLSRFLEEEIGRQAEETAVVEALTAFRPDAGAGLLLAGLAVVVLVILLAGSVLASLLRYYGFVLTADGDVLRATGGLLTRHEHSVGRAKVQSMTIVQNVVLRLFGRFRLRIRQAAASRVAASRDFQVPVARRHHLDAVGREIFRDEFSRLPVDPADAAFERISPWYVRSRFLIFGVLPATAAVPLLWPEVGAAAAAALLWLPASALVVARVHRRYGVAVSRHGVAVRSGFIGSRVVIWLHRKVQRVTVTQSPLQRRRKLATLRFHLAAGSVRIPFVDHAAALRLRDYVLYCVESSRLPWH